MTIIQQLQDDIVNQEVNLTSVLLKAKILAYRLRHDEFKNWVDSELNGYPDEDSIPCYRRYQTHSYGDFFGSLGRHMTNAPIPTLNLPDPLQGFAKEISMIQGVGSLEDMVNSPDMTEYGAVKFAWPPDIVALASRFSIYEDMNLGSAWKLINSGHINQILGMVRNKLLDFVLKLQEQFPELTESNERIGDIPVEQTDRIFNVYISGSQNVVAVGTNITQNVQQEVSPNDISSLLSYLKSIGVPEADTQELKEAVEEDGPAEESAGFGPRVRDWLGKKTAEGALNATLSGIALTAAKAVAQYYGWLT